MWGKVRYSPLPPHEDTLDEASLSADKNKVSDHPPRSSGLSLWAFFTCTLFTSFNLLILLFSHKTHNFGPPERSVPLPRPNQYIGLESINRTAPGVKVPKPLVNYPLILTQISRLNKNFVYPDDPHRWYSWVGTVSPDDRHFFVNEDIHTIAQFRVHDFGMDSCQVVINIPTTSELNGAESRVDSPNKTGFSLEPARVPVEVWKLKADMDLRVRQLSWNSRPRRQELVEILNVTEGDQAASPRFPCPSDSLQTFEFACMDERGPCRVDFWQDKREPMIAAVLLQHSTVG